MLCPSRPSGSRPSFWQPLSSLPSRTPLVQLELGTQIVRWRSFSGSTAPPPRRRSAMPVWTSSPPWYEAPRVSTHSGGGRGGGMSTTERTVGWGRLSLSTGQPWVRVAFLLPLRRPLELAGKQQEVPFKLQLAAGPSLREEGSSVPGIMHRFHCLPRR